MFWSVTQVRQYVFLDYLNIFVLRDVDERWRFTLVCFTISKFYLNKKILKAENLYIFEIVIYKSIFLASPTATVSL